MQALPEARPKSQSHQQAVPGALSRHSGQADWYPKDSVMIEISEI